jgi:magnesium chelatase family protein
MYARVLSGAVVGVDGVPVEVEVDCCGGLGQISVVGLPDTSIKEAQERVRSAIKSCSFLMPPGKRWVVNLAPCDLRKEGASYDLPMATGILIATGLIPAEHIADLWFVGELSLSGAVRSVNGVLPVALAARDWGAKGIVVPEENAQEASMVDGLTIYPVSHLMQVFALGHSLSNGTVYSGQGIKEIFNALPPVQSEADFKDVRGQVAAKRALEIAAAGRHNLLMIGPPGTGKSMLAERLPGILPPLECDEAIELTKLFSVAGLLKGPVGLVTRRPFRNPHHSASVVGLIGGGLYPKPGEISLSHLGVLFLDELTEFRRTHLDNLRQPLEARKVIISRAGQSLTYPAAFMLVAACNPCPCGYRGDSFRHCVCTAGQAERYWSRISGPLLDRIDMQVEVSRLSEKELLGGQEEESSREVLKRVLRAVERQKLRHEYLHHERSFVFNGLISHVTRNPIFKLDSFGDKLITRAVSQFGLSARAYSRVLKLSRTIADLCDCDDIAGEHVAEALRYRLASHC